MLDDNAQDSILILHSSRFGQAQSIAKAIANKMVDYGLRVDVQALDKNVLRKDSLLLHHRQGVVLVASVRYGHFAPIVQSFVRRYHSVLAQKPSAFASVSLTARQAFKNTPETNIYTRKFLARSAMLGWRPGSCAAFAGALRYGRYNWLDRQVIRLIMRITGGKTDQSTDEEYTDWGRVDEFALQIIAQFIKDDETKDSF